MKEITKKLVICILLLFASVSCTTTTKFYSYGETILENKNNSPYKYGEYINIRASVVEQSSVNSPLSSVRFTPSEKYKKLEILNEKIKLVYKDKEYYIDKELFMFGKTVASYYSTYSKGIIINGDFILYIGKIKLDDKKIVDIPPLKFRKYIEVSNGNMILEGNIKADIYNGPLEDYKGD